MSQERVQKERVQRERETPQPPTPKQHLNDVARARRAGARRRRTGKEHGR